MTGKMWLALLAGESNQKDFVSSRDNVIREKKSVSHKGESNKSFIGQYALMEKKGTEDEGVCSWLRHDGVGDCADVCGLRA